MTLQLVTSHRKQLAPRLYTHWRSRYRAQYSQHLQWYQASKHNLGKAGDLVVLEVSAVKLHVWHPVVYCENSVCCKCNSHCLDYRSSVTGCNSYCNTTWTYYWRSRYSQRLQWYQPLKHILGKAGDVVVKEPSAVKLHVWHPVVSWVLSVLQM